MIIVVWIVMMVTPTGTSAFPPAFVVFVSVSAGRVLGVIVTTTPAVFGVLVVPVASTSTSASVGGVPGGLFFRALLLFFQGVVGFVDCPVV